MRAAAFQRHGDPEVIEIVDLPTPEPGPGEVRIAVHAAAFNHLDLFVRRGIPGLVLELPHIGGSDMAGVVDAVGPGVEGWQAGDAVVVNPSLPCLVCPMCRRGDHPLCDRYRIIGEHVAGGMAEYAVVPAHRLHPKPEALSWVEAASVPLAFQTAWRALVTRARVRAGEDVLVLGAGGGVATAAIQIARLAGARVIAVTSSPERMVRVRDLGADVVIDRSAEAWAKAVWSATGKRGADVVVDSVGAATWRDSLRSAARLGRIVTYGATTGPTPETDIRVVFWKQLAILGSTMATDAEFDAAMRQVAAGRLRPVVGTVLPLDEARRGHELLEAGQVFGKLVLQVR
jgi:NADPH:quinone reductase-like Zn-dependent oxidoreductase